MNILALDVGTKKIGVALGSLISTSARPLSPLLDVQKHFQELSQLIRSWQIQRVVLGHPGHRNTNQPVLEYLVRIQEYLQKAHPSVSVVFWSEEGSSQEATSVCKTLRGGKHSRDSIAATLILENYLYFSKPALYID